MLLHQYDKGYFFITLKAPAKNYASENGVCLSRLLHIFDNIIK